MLATLVIGLREGLEAALIVGIIAAFLRRNGRSLIPMWIGVSAALVASIAVGIALTVVEQALPQAAQEGMETVIGAVAVIFVTSMIVWMQKHARGMKRELEAEASHALNEGTAWALAGMAFLAVLKEGFKTSVFLLATFQAASNAGLAALGAVIGVAAAVVIGIGIYAGGIRIDLGRFFRFTGAFLLLVAAGLVVSALRTAHEAGWLVAGQQPTVDLSWLAPTGSVQAALLTGVLGIPADPRVIEVVGWLAYLVPMALFMFWPARRRPSGRAVPRIQLGVAGGLAVLAIAAAAAAPLLLRPASAPLALDDGGTARLVTGPALRADGRTIPLHASASRTIAGLTTWTVDETGGAAGPATVTLAELSAQNANRVPVGIDVRRAPGPYAAAWTETATLRVTTRSGILIDARQDGTRLVTLSGGGLSTPRTLSTPGGDSWAATDDAVAAASSAVGRAADETRLWGLHVPTALAIAAIVLLAVAIRTLLRTRREDAAASQPAATDLPPTAQALPAEQKATRTYATH